MDSEKNHKVLILGVGGAGSNTVRALKAQKCGDWFHTIVIDTDSANLEDQPGDENLALSSEWLIHGVGCGGDIMRGQRAMTPARNLLPPMMQGYDLIIVTAGLGGGTATGGLSIIASMIRSLGTPSIFLLTTPFAFEPFSRSKNTEDCVKELYHATDILLLLPNDLLFSLLPPATPASQAFSLAAQETAKTLAGIADVMRCRSLIGSDYAVFMAALQKHQCVCGIGIGQAEINDGPDRTNIALERLLASPFLGGRDFLMKSDCVLITISGGNNMTMAELKRSFEQAGAALAPEAHIVLGVNILPDNPSFYQITAVAIHYTECKETQPSSRRSHGGGTHRTEPGATKTEPQKETGGLCQGELPLANYSRGIFENYKMVKYKDVDLDVPTFQRIDLHFDKG